VGGCLDGWLGLVGFMVGGYDLAWSVCVGVSHKSV